MAKAPCWDGVLLLLSMKAAPERADEVCAALFRVCNISEMATFNRISDALLLIPSLIRTAGGVGPDAGSAVSQDGCGHVAAVGKGVHECGHDLWRDTTDLCSERNWLAGWTDEIAPGRQGLH